MLNRIKRWFFIKNLPKSSNSFKGTGVNPQKRIAILFDGSTEDDRKVVHEFKKRMKNSGASVVKSLAFVNNKLPLDNVDYAAYNLKNVNWYGFPSGQKVEEFIEGQWDVVIFLGDDMAAHFEFILRNVNASFIIGATKADNNNLFHLSIDSSETKNLTQKINTIIKSIDIISIKKIS